MQTCKIGNRAMALPRFDIKREWKFEKKHLPVYVMNKSGTLSKNEPDPGVETEAMGTKSCLKKVSFE